MFKKIVVLPIKPINFLTLLVPSPPFLLNLPKIDQGNGWVRYPSFEQQGSGADPTRVVLHVKLSYSLHVR